MTEHEIAKVLDARVLDNYGFLVALVLVGFVLSMSSGAGLATAFIHFRRCGTMLMTGLVVALVNGLVSYVLVYPRSTVVEMPKLCDEVAAGVFLCVALLSATLVVAGIAALDHPELYGGREDEPRTTE